MKQKPKESKEMFAYEIFWGKKLQYLLPQNLPHQTIHNFCCFPKHKIMKRDSYIYKIHSAIVKINRTACCITLLWLEPVIHNSYPKKM